MAWAMRHSLPGAAVAEASGEEQPFTSVRCLFRMGPQISTLIHGFKYRHMQRHILFLCEYFRFRPDLAEWARGFDALIPVPIHRTRRRERGYNQAEKIARAASEHLGVPVLADALIRTRMTGSQTKLNRKERGVNLEKAFACPSPESLRGRRLLIVDDVFTTGATAGRCAELLLAAGALEIGVLTLARVETAVDLDDFALEMEAVSSYAS